MTTSDKHSVLFATGSLFDESSGPYTSLMQTADTLQKRGNRVAVVGTSGRRNGRPSQWSVDAHAFSRYGPYSLHFAPEMARWFNYQPWRWDVASLEIVWSYVNRIVANQCVRNNTPYMITTHGNFNPAALNISYWKKTVARNTFLKSAFKYVTCYHALTHREYTFLREYGITQPVCVIGNGITIPAHGGLLRVEDFIPDEMLEKRTCLYLGRLHPIKGVDRLLQAWNDTGPGKNWQLVIAGDGDLAFRAKLEKMAQQTGCYNIHFIGFVRGDLKSAWYSHADFLVLPSYSEAFPMAVLEAFSHGTPALITESCGLTEAAKFGAAVEVESSDAGIKDGLQGFMDMTASDLKQMEENALRFVVERHDWQIICQQLEGVYSWMRGVGPAPDCLYFE